MKIRILLMTIMSLLSIENIQSQNYASLPFEDGFEAGQFEASWQARPNLVGSNGLVQVHMSARLQGDYGVRIGKSSDSGGLTTNALDLHLNLQNATDVKLNFRIWDFRNETHSLDGLYFSNDGGTNFTKVFDFNPQSWCDEVWSRFPVFDVDKLAAENTIGFTNQFVIRFQQHDDGDFNTSGDEDGFYIDNVSVYSRPIAYAELPFFDDFEAGSLGASWAEAQAYDTALPLTGTIKPTGLTGVSQSAALAGDYGLIMGKRCDDGPTTNAMDLHLNLEGETDVKLNFHIWDFRNETDNQDALYFSDNGGQNFTKVFGFNPQSWCDEVWGRFPVFDVDKLALDNGLSLTNQFVIRFQQHDDADFNTSGDEDGFYIDNVRVYSRPVVYAELPFFDDFEVGSLGESWAEAQAYDTALPLTGTIKPTGLTGVSQSAELEGDYGLIMGKRCDDGATTNAIDLHLNLAGQSHVKLSFYIWDFRNETDNQDALYISNDGGENFTKVYSFNPQSWCDEVWGVFPPFDVDKLAAENNIEFTSQFVIRFQQHDDADFNTSGDEDGFYIDYVNVYSRPPVYAGLPFFDGLETGRLENYWQRPHPDDTALPLTGTVKPTGLSGVISSNQYQGDYCLRMGKRCDDGMTSNALDLYLNLNGLTEVNLAFWLKDFRDENNNQDAIYASDNGGLDFTKIYGFNFQSIPDETYQYFDIDLGDLIEQNNLDFTGNFVIRFQQVDDADFNTSGDEDGIFIDNINIEGNETTSTENLYYERLIKTFPNPTTTSTLTLQYPQISGSTVITLTDLNGKQLLQKTVQGTQTSLDLAGLSSGIYFISFVSEDYTATRKILKSEY